MAAQGAAPPQKNASWSQAELRIWCLGGWRLQIRGGEVRPLAGPAAEEALARHLAVRDPIPVSGPELRELLSRKPDRPIPKQSLHVAANKLRELLASAAPAGQDGKRLAKRLLPNATSAVENETRIANYGFGSDVWVDLFDARDLLAFRWLPVDRKDLAGLGGGRRSQPFNGFAQLAMEASERLHRAVVARDDLLPEHLKRFTPPIQRLENLVPVALDRLQPGSMVVIGGKGGSGRMHLAEAIELAALTWDGRAAEQIRDLPAGSPSPDGVSPGALYIVDLTRKLKDSQRDRLREIREARDKVEDPEERPSLLVIADDPSVEATGDFAGWNRPQPISLPPPSEREVTEAYLIATRSIPRDPEERQEEFEALAREYTRRKGSQIELRAASSAASFAVDERRVPTVEEISPPENPPPDTLRGALRETALALAWFGNDPFTMADAKAASGRPDLLLSEVFRIATRIPGGGAGTYEIHPALLEEKPANEVPQRICEYLLEKGNEEAAERWPLRAVRILSAQSVNLQSQLRLAPILIDLARDLGFAPQLERKMRTLLRKADPSTPDAIWGAIGRARLLIHLGRLGEAEEVLKPLTRDRASRAPKQMQAEAHLRLAIVASQRGHRAAANEHAAKARALSPRKLGGRVRRYHGWEALYTARFEKATRVFERTQRSETGAENRADAMVGATLALLRLGRLREAEELLEELATIGGLRRITRNRIIRAEATAMFLREGPRPGVEILDKALGQDGGRVSRQSADLLEARAYLHAKLGGDALPAAKRDLKRSEPLLHTEDEWQKAMIFYLKGLVAEAEMRAAPQPSEELRRKARESAERSVAAAEENPWHQARGQTLLARLEVAGGDRERLARHLRAATAAHRGLGALCPDALRETLELGSAAAAAWRLDDERRRLESLAAELGPRDVPADPGTTDALALLDEVARVAATQPRPTGTGAAQGATVRALGRLGETLLQGGKEALARGMPLAARLLHPRDTASLAAGIYELDLSTGDLAPAPGLPTKGMSILRGAGNRRFAERRLGAVLLVDAKASGADGSGPLLLGQWLEGFRAQARKDGVAVIDSIALEPNALESLGLRPADGFVALGLAELPKLG